MKAALRRGRHAPQSPSECGDHSPLWAAALRYGKAARRCINTALQGRLRRRFHGDYSADKKVTLHERGAPQAPSECGDYSPLWAAAVRYGQTARRCINTALQGRLRRRFHGDYSADKKVTLHERGEPQAPWSAAIIRRFGLRR